MTKRITLEFSSIEDLFAFRECIKTVTYNPGMKSLTVSCDLTNVQLAQAISLNAIPIPDTEDSGLMLSDYLCRSVFKNAYGQQALYPELLNPFKLK